MKKINLAIVGATGMVGKTFLKVLANRKIKKQIKNLYLFASIKSAKEKVLFDKKEYLIEELSEANIIDKKIDFAFFATEESISKQYAPIFNKYKIKVIDNSSAFRLEKDIPLIIPEVNYTPTKSMIISNPNCSTIQCVLPLAVLQKNYGIKSINYTTYQAVSGSGVKGIEDLRATLSGKKPKFYPYKICDNCLPHIGSFSENYFTTEELKMIYETQKILCDKKLKISATCVRVPVENCHSISVSVKLKKKVDIEKIKTLFANTKGLKLFDEPQKNIYPLCQFANNQDDILVGRIRKDLFDNKILHFFCVADNIRKGASTNGVQILEKLLEEK